MAEALSRTRAAANPVRWAANAQTRHDRAKKNRIEEKKMKTKQIISFGLLLILVTLILVIAIHNIPGSSAGHRQEIIVSPSPTTFLVLESVSSVTPEIPFIETAEREPIPSCTFNAQAQPRTPISSLDAYVFSEPEVVLTSATALRLFQWLPDGQRWLIGRDVAGKAEQTLEVFDLRTGETRLYAQAQIVGDKVAWLETEQAVLFVESLPDNRNMLKLSYGADEPARELMADFRSPFSVRGGGEQLIFSANDQGGQLRVLQVSDGAATPLLTQLSGYYHTVPSADETWMAVYNHLHFYLANLVSEQVCEIDLGQVGTGEYAKVRASDVTWSKDGRYLAMLTKYGNPVRFFSLRIIDLQAKALYDIVFDERFVFSIDWLPTSHMLLAAIDANPDPSLGSFDNLYLVDVASRNSRHILPEHQFFAAGDFGVLWSPDGKTIGVACADFTLPDEVREWRICTIEMEIQQ
mgnify:CR=1 FL=1